MPGLMIGSKTRRELARLLGVLQDHLESSIESALVPGTSELPADAPDFERASIARDRADWKSAEVLIGKLAIETKTKRDTTASVLSVERISLETE